MDKDLADFLTYLVKERGCSLCTLDAYRATLVLFLAWLARSYQLGPRQIDAPILHAWLKSLWQKNPAPATVQRNLSALRSFYRYLWFEGRAPAALCTAVTNLGMPKIPAKLPVALTVREVELLLQAPQSSSRTYVRDVAVLEVLYSTGVRVSELCDLTPAGLYLAEGFARVRGKGDADRIVPLGSKCREALQRWLARRGRLPLSVAAPWLFLCRGAARMSRSGVFGMVRYHARAAGIGRRVSPHTLRRSFATHLVENGADIAMVRMMLGHVSLATTERYVAVATDKLQLLHEACHPLGHDVKEEVPCAS